MITYWTHHPNRPERFKQVTEEEYAKAFNAGEQVFMAWDPDASTSEPQQELPTGWTDLGFTVDDSEVGP